MITDHNSTVCVEFHNSKKCQIVDFVPEFSVEEGECAQSFCAQTLFEDQ